MSYSTKTVQMVIHDKVFKALNPHYLEIVNESSKHNVPKGSESHFKLVVVSDLFEGKTLIQRHRMINDILREEINSKIHALSIQAKTTLQWEGNNREFQTPPCLGGDKPQKG